MVRGVVTLVLPGTGFFIESTTPDGDPATSEALLVLNPDAKKIASIGDRLVAAGVVDEIGEGRDTQTALRDTSVVERCGPSELPLTELTLPATRDRRESLENMRVAVNQPMTVTDAYGAGRGYYTLASGGILHTPTEVVDPGSTAAERRAENDDRSVPARWAKAPGLLPSGSELVDIEAILAHDDRGKRMTITAAVARPIRAPDLKPRVAGAIRVAVVNLHNYFNGDGRGANFNPRRGSGDQEEFLRQKSRITAAMAQLDADLLAVSELENDGFGPLSAAASLLGALNQQADTWSIVDPGTERIGNDEITVGLLYRRDRLQPEGPATMLSVPPFFGSKRQPMAQSFRSLDGSGRFAAVAVHLKSKGGCPEGGANSDSDDGQKCWNGARVESARAIADWAKSSGLSDVLILGDMNAYRREDPIRAMTAAGFADLVAEDGQTPSHTFSYFGRLGTLDYAFASRAMAGRIDQIQVWHVNAGWPPGVDLPEPWLRYSDHDPVVVDFSF